MCICNDLMVHSGGKRLMVGGKAEKFRPLNVYFYKELNEYEIFDRLSLLIL